MLKGGSVVNIAKGQSKGPPCGRKRAILNEFQTGEIPSRKGIFFIATNKPSNRGMHGFHVTN